LAHRSPERAAGVLAAQCEAVAQMRAVLVDLARGIYPRLLTDEGIGPALRAALASSPVPVELSTRDVGRYGVAVETAVYFCCLEAVQNAGKHSGAQRVVIDLRDGPEGLVLTVEDDGEGFHEHPPRPGVGLANMRDRIEALGGALLFETADAGGARVSVRVPSERGPGVGTFGPELPQSRVP
jgi:signal transduction histidine kinase